MCERLPGTDARLISETWELIERTASRRLRTAQNALTGQQECVAELKKDLTERVRQKPGFGVPHWVEVYSQEARRTWTRRRSNSPAAAAYPELFDETIQRIRGIVDEAIGSEVAEAQMKMVHVRKRDIRRDVREELNRGEMATFKPHFARFLELVRDDWKLHELSEQEPDLLEPTLISMRGIVQDLVDAQHKLLEELLERARAKAAEEVTTLDELENYEERVRDILQRPIPADQREEITADIAKLRLKIVESLQNRVVDRVKSAIKTQVEEDYRSGKEPTKEAVVERFARAVSRRWVDEYQHRAATLGEGWKTLRTSVKERMRGIVDDLLEIIPKTLRSQVLDRQRALVEARQPHMQRVIQTDYDNGEAVAKHRKEYRLRYERLVGSDWDQEVLSRAAGFAGLLPPIKEQIGGIIDDLIKEFPVRPVQEPSPDSTEGGAARTAADNSSEGESKGGDGDDGGDGGGGSGGPGGGGTGSGGVGQGGDGQGGMGGVAAGGPGAGSGMGMAGGEGTIQKPENLLPLSLLFWLVLALLLILLATFCYYLYTRWADGDDTAKPPPVPTGREAARARQQKCAIRFARKLGGPNHYADLSELKSAMDQALHSFQQEWNENEASEICPELGPVAIWVICGAVMPQPNDLNAK
jgi:hypothetical protein